MKMDTKNTNVVAENVYQTETFTQLLQTDVGLRKTTVTVHFEYDAVLEQYFVTAVLSNGRKPKIYEGSLHAIVDSLKHEKIYQHWLDKLIISFFNDFQPECVNKGYEPYSIDAIHESALGQNNTCTHASIHDFRITSTNDSNRIDEIDDYLDDVKKGNSGLMLPERIAKEIMKEIQKLPTSDEVSND